jgi:hypothetical protein
MLAHLFCFHRFITYVLNLCDTIVACSRMPCIPPLYFPLCCCPCDVNVLLCYALPSNVRHTDQPYYVIRFFSSFPFPLLDAVPLVLYM